MIQFKDIKPKAGFGALEFNSSIDYAVNMLGQPDHIEELEGFDDERSMAYIYNNQNLIAFFEGLHSMVLTILETKDPEVTLFGQKVFDMEESAIHELMKANGYVEKDIEETSWGGRRVSYEDADMDFYFGEVKLNAINWGCFRCNTEATQ